MAASIQAVVAGLLLVAWFWVLRRPMVEGSGRSSGQQGSYLDRVEADATSWSMSGSTSMTLSSLVPPPIVRWRRQPVAHRRRQLMLATMFATFASFLMAIALRDRFVYLFILMGTALVGHIVLASRLGARAVADQRARHVKQASARVKPRSTTDGITIRAPRVAVEHVANLGGVPLVLEGLAEPEPVKVTTLVSELIDSEWGESAIEVEQEPEVVADQPKPAADEPGVANSEAESTTDSVTTEPVTAGATEPAAEEKTDPEASTPEPIFTVAAKDIPSRSRRKAQPIYIESQLDEPADEIPAAKAVNHP